jgi:hypothetical protein
MRLLAKELIISDASVRNKMAQDICYKSYALKQGRFLNQATKGRRLTKVKLMLKKLKKSAKKGRLIFFSDEKNFPQDQKVNRMNN